MTPMDMRRSKRHGWAALAALLPMGLFAAGNPWPGLAPDCWPEPRLFHSAAEAYPWKRHTAITAVAATDFEAQAYSPNGGYAFRVDGGRPSGKVMIYAEKGHLIEIAFSKLYGLTEVKWINEKLLFMRPWWGRIAATDIIFDVERERVIYAESVTDGRLAFQQYRESCATLGGCRCIKK